MCLVRDPELLCILSYGCSPGIGERERGGSRGGGGRGGMKRARGEGERGRGEGEVIITHLISAIKRTSMKLALM